MSDLHWPVRGESTATFVGDVAMTCMDSQIPGGRKKADGHGAGKLQLPVNG
jgi:hypothetical protein